MLKQLTIKNLAIIDDITIDFENNLNVKILQRKNMSKVRDSLFWSLSRCLKVLGLIIYLIIIMGCLEEASQISEEVS